MVIRYLLSSSITSANSFFVSANSSLSCSFSSLQTTLMHFKSGQCCFGCLPLNCGCVGATEFGCEGSEVSHTPRISVTTSSSCWALIVCLTSAHAAVGPRLVSFPLAVDCLLFFATVRVLKQKCHLKSCAY